MALVMSSSPASMSSSHSSGIGTELSHWLESSRAVRNVLYSSCNAESLARDLAAMPSLRPTRARLFDMFPQTRHHEVLVLLERRGVSWPGSRA